MTTEDLDNGLAQYNWDKRDWATIPDCGSERVLTSKLQKLHAKLTEAEALLDECEKTIAAASRTLTEDCKVVLGGKRWGEELLNKLKQRKGDNHDN